VGLRRAGGVFVCVFVPLIKFWPSRAPGKGVCGGAKFFLAPPYYSQRAVFASHLSAFFIVYEL